jgi:uncharacterized membrane protein
MKLAGVWLWVFTALAVLVGLASYRYLVLGPAGAPSNVAANRFAASALVLHASLGATALILGPAQFFASWRARWPAWHRRSGTLYVTCCLIGGVAGLVLAAGTSAGPVGVAGFGLLAACWIGATANAWRFARARNFAAHRRWMTRSFALTFAAVTLRLYLPLAIMAHIDMAAAYRAISFLCWVPNLAVAELWLRQQGAVRTIPPLAGPSQSRG